MTNSPGYSILLACITYGKSMTEALTKHIGILVLCVFGIMACDAGLLENKPDSDGDSLLVDGDVVDGDVDGALGDGDTVESDREVSDRDQDVADGDQSIDSDDEQNPDGDESEVDPEIEEDNDTEIVCVCTTGPCCDGCNFFGMDHICQPNEEGTAQYRCTISGCGGDLEVRLKNRYCSGTSADCTGSLIDDQWRLQDTCEDTEKCNPGLAQCILDRPTCDPTYCAFGSGPCCDDSTNTLYSNDHVCQTNADTEVGCPDGTGCGTDVKRRYRDKLCSGASPLCNGSLASWKVWSIEEACQDTYRCNSVQGSCVQDRPTCDPTYCAFGSGPCCDDSMNTLFGGNHICQADADTEIGCPDGTGCGTDVKRRYRDKLCSGASPLCNGSLASWKVWSIEEACQDTYRCNSVQGSCVQDRPTCDPAYCMSGVCCNTAIQTLYGRSHICERNIPGDDYRCQGSDCGNDVEVKYQERYCDGASSSCSGRLENTSTWGVIEDCETNQRCHPSNYVCEAFSFHDTIQCDGLDRYYYNECGVREEFIENCGDVNNCTADSCSPSGCANVMNTCHNQGTCNLGDGVCSCNNPFMTADCSACQNGYVGYPDCREDSPTAGFVSITAGTFWMGSPANIMCPEEYPGACTGPELGRGSNEPLHRVTLTYNFELKTHEVTQGEFENLLAWNPSSFSSCGSNCPVEYVSWYDALAYANKRSSEAGLTPCYVFANTICRVGTNVGSDPLACMNPYQLGIKSATVTLTENARIPQECEGYRLPTEAEWEFAIRVGWQYTAFYISIGNNGLITDTSCSDANLDQIGWYCGNNNPYSTKAVGTKEANHWGLYDMSGNVAEWVWDGYQANYQADSSIDPAGLSTSLDRIHRGGSWIEASIYCRSAYRPYTSLGVRSNHVGFRLCRSLP